MSKFSKVSRTTKYQDYIEFVHSYEMRSNKFKPSLLIHLMFVCIHVLQIPELDWSLMKNRDKINNSV